MARVRKWRRRPDRPASGPSPDTVDGPDSTVARLLAAAAAPARPEELAGEDAALAAFRAARAAGPVPAHRPPRHRAAPVTAWLAALAVVATAGAAMAAADLRDAEPPPAHHTTSPPVTAVPAPADGPPVLPAPTSATGRTFPPVTGRSVEPTTGPADPTGPGPVRPSGLCVAYLAQPPQTRGAALESPALRSLVAAAGGPSRVEAYCRDLVGPPGRRAEAGPPAGRPGRSSPPN